MELKNITIKEVSLVDTPANKRKFLLFKREDKKGVKKGMKFKDLKLEGIEGMGEKDVVKVLEQVVAERDDFEKKESEFKLKEAKLKAKIAEVEKKEKELEGKVSKVKEEVTADIGKVLDEVSLTKVKDMLYEIQNLTSTMAGLAQVALSPPLDVTKAVKKVTEELKKEHEENIEKVKKEYDEVVDDLVKSVEILKEGVVTKEVIGAVIKEAIEEYKKSN